MTQTERLLLAGWNKGDMRPNDGQLVAYLFEPFDSLHVGEYHKIDDSVFSNAEFTNWQPEVSAWLALPG